MESWTDLKIDTAYEISTEYPNRIRRRSNGKIISEWLDNTGYYRVNLNGKKYLKHRLVADQFIYNDDPETKTQVDHVNRNKTDNRIENLRHCSPSENLLNRSMNDTTIFVDELPEDAIIVDHYGTYENIEGLYYYDGIFYVDTGVNYKSLTKLETRNGYYFVKVKLLEGPKIKIYYKKFKQEYGLK